MGADIVSILPRNKNMFEFFYNLACLKVCFFLLHWVGQLVVHILNKLSDSNFMPIASDAQHDLQTGWRLLSNHHETAPPFQLEDPSLS